MLDPEIVERIRLLQQLRWGSKRIARELGIARNSVRRYLRGGAAAEVQARPNARTLDTDQVTLARELLDGAAAGNAVVVQRLLAERQIDVPLRTLQRTLEPHRQARRAAALATVRFETPPGAQLQIDFGEKWVVIGGVRTRVYVFVGVLGYSRRIFVRASLSQRQDDWREGLAAAFRTFGGVTRKILIDRAGALVIGQERETGTARIHPAFAAFCKDWGVEVTACRPYRARTKGKTESGVGYVKHNAIAGRAFDSFAALEAHLAQWMTEADRRVHGTTHEQPCVRFERAERAALQPLPAAPLRVRERRLQRRVATDCFVDIDTVRYSVPHALVRRHVEVVVGDVEVVIYDGRVEVARHRRSTEPHQRVMNPRHLDGLYRRRHDDAPAECSPLTRSLDVYAEAVGGAP
ncbi:MAG: IS21 family transposase [Kofleriaceae bacterium]